MEGRLPHQQGTLRTNSHVLRPHQLPCHLPDYDERHLKGLDRRGTCHGLLGRHPHILRRPIRALTAGGQGPDVTATAWALPQEGEVRLREALGRLPGCHRRGGEGQDRPGQDRCRR